MKTFRVFLLEDDELVDMGDVDSEQQGANYVKNEGVVGMTYYVINLDMCSTYHVRRELHSGDTPQV